MIIIVNGLRVFIGLCLSEALQETNAVILAELRKQHKELDHTIYWKASNVITYIASVSSLSP